MQVSEARLAANRANAARSTGPTSDLGKSASRRNGLKHGLTGEGIVVPEGDQQEIEARVEALEADLKPRSPLGSIMIRKMATLSVRSERSAERENAAIAERIRNAVDVFDKERGGRVDSLFAALPEDPRGCLRQLKQMPEGVDCLLDAWRVLRHDLARDSRVDWTGSHLGRAANMTGVRLEHAQSSRLGDLSNAIWGDFYGLADHEGGDLDDEARRKWARDRLLERVDAEIAGLEAHRAGLDLDRIERDRLEAPARSTFDASKEATLARRYEADSDRGFYKALKEFRQAEAAVPARVDAAPDVPTLGRLEPRMGSSCAATPPLDRERPLAYLDLPTPENPVVRGLDGQPLSITRPLPPPR